MFFIGFTIGCLSTLLFVREKLIRAKQFQVAHEENIQLKGQLEVQKVISENYQKQLDGLDERLTRQFKAASLELFQENAQNFVQLAENSLKHYREGEKESLENQRIVFEKTVLPLKENLERFTSKIEQLESGRQKNEISLKEQLQQLNQIQFKLENKTDLLTHVFYNPNQRGRWGEIQLKRIVEMADMLEYVDFDTQVTEQGSGIRPDMVIRLPNDRCVIIDAKTPQLENYFSAIQQQHSEEEQQRILKNCCLRIRDMVQKLSAKSYGIRFEHSVDFVVLFFPGEWIFSRAIQQDINLIEYGCKNNVIFATPTTLIALLKAIHYGWKQNKMIEEVKSIEVLGSELYERILTFNGYFQDLRKNLSKSVDSYNQLLSSFESRILPSARKLNTFSKKSTPIIEPLPLDIDLKTM